MLDRAALGFLNHLLADADWARTQLRPFAGRTLQLIAPPLNLALVVDTEGHFAGTASDTFDVTLELPALASQSPLAGPEALLRAARINGNAEFAQTLGFVLRHLRWDHEEDLSRFVGDIAAHRITRGLSSLLRWQREAGQNLLANIAEYLSEEQPVLVSRSAAQTFQLSVEKLSNDLARLQQRLDKRA